MDNTINITVNPTVRAILRRDRDTEAYDVVDIEVVIKALTHEIRKKNKIILALEEKVVKQRKYLAELEKRWIGMPTTIEAAHEHAAKSTLKFGG